MFGTMICNKPIGWTSNDVVRRVKGWLGERKIGHGGTLDPNAEGVLVLGIGKEGTRELSIILNHTLKTYEALIEFGAVSTTDDQEGVITQTFLKTVAKLPFPNEIEQCLQKFTGEFLQIPPIYSAIKVAGVPAYKRVRQGEKINLEAKKVFVREIKLLEYSYPKLKIELTCGSGFYVRALARDLGKALGVGGYLKELKRTRIWNPENTEIDFNIEDGVTIENIVRDCIEMNIRAFGKVQGVGFRAFVQKEARKFQLNGSVENILDGSVEIVTQGKIAVLRKFLDGLFQNTSPARIDTTRILYKKPQNYLSNFNIMT